MVAHDRGVGHDVSDPPIRTVSATQLGTGNPLPDARRAGAATLVRSGTKTHLEDLTTV